MLFSFLLACASSDPLALAAWEAGASPGVDEPPGRADAADVDSAEEAPATDSAEEAPLDGVDPDGGDAGAPTCATFDPAERMGRLPDGLDEVSGLVASRAHPGVLWALEDSGNAPELVALDFDGARLATVALPVPNVDWEDLALAPCGDQDCLWIADVGDNDLVRGEVALHVVPEPALRDQTLDAVQTLRIRYADGPHNVEAVVVVDGEPVLLSKRDDGQSEVIREVDGQFRAVGRVAVAAEGDDARASRVTAASFREDTGELLLRTYDHLWRYGLAERGVDGLVRAQAEELSAPAQPQVETVAWDVEVGGWWQTSEGEGADLWFVGCAEG